jgi:glycosyltransferase involved in cell wall biosynthesis
LGAPLKKWLAENPSDVLIVQGGYLSAAVALSGLRKKPVLIGCDHLDPARMNPLHSIVSRITYPRLDALVVLTEAYRRYYSGWLQAVYCIPNFVDLEAAGCSNRDKKRLIACGRLTKQKGFDLLLHALVPVLTRYTDWEVVIYGAGPEKNALEALKVRLGLRAVSFPGETTDVPHKLAGASVFVMPSRYEGFPVALLEAMATGLPCVCFESPGTAAMIDDGTNGLLVPAEDTGAFSEALMRVMDDPETARRLGREASRKALLFSRPAVAERWKELFLLRPLLQKP